MTDLETIALVMLETINGGALPSLGSLWDKLRPPPTIPLGPFVPPKPDPRIA